MVADHTVAAHMVGVAVHTAVRTVGVAVQGTVVRIVAAFGLGLHTL